ncbi:unnamed protein product [Spirodela intermedia]|uniref:Cytochrome b-c1 complex subunit 6 n=1 Tax=Spirodela intermedia TaxID=51605 RepID=A0A7I8J0M8_SPIIN|nr:unnamed protein product [Spirodela intermedia]CAA6663775.1 unnamed protein product [Spirodela intermedia]
MPADDEPVDPKRHIEDNCKPKCVKSWVDYGKCIQRIKDDNTGHKHCTGQYFDYWSCVDQCAGRSKLFRELN